ncbi:MAG: TA system VapC family ribonuclease toxin [Edaphobacter sp.]
MTSLVFPDINVWLALSSSIHVHHIRAKRWFDLLTEDEELVFCRLTQLGLLRLLTTATVMGDGVRTQKQAWAIYDAFLRDGGARFLQEPRTLEESFRRISRSTAASPKDWADSYLAAFAMETGAKLITLDKALGGRAAGSIVLRPE